MVDESTNDIFHLFKFFEIRFQMPVFDDELKMITGSNIVRNFGSWHVCGTHDSNEHVKHVNNHKEGRNYEDRN